MESKLQPPQFPWESDDDLEIVANLTIGSLRDSVMKWLTTERGIHAETLMVSIGAIAGFAAQMAAFASIGPAGTPIPDGAVVMAEAGGQRFYFGDRINGYLVRQAGESEHPLWGFVVAAALQAGMPEKDMPDVRELFAHVSKTVGTPDFGVPRVPEGISPQLTARQALEAFWPGAKDLLSNANDVLLPATLPLHGVSVPVVHWPLVVALVARQFILMAKDTLAPRVALCLVMETAIAASKLDPKTVPQTPPEGS